MSELKTQKDTQNHIAQLKENSQNISTYTWLPELPQADAKDIYDRITEHEARLASPDLSEKGYEQGTAIIDNALYTVRGMTSGLLTAEHATAQQREGAVKDADWGTAGLGQVVHEDSGASFIAAIGRQAGDANFDTEHPVKSEIRSIMEDEHPLVIAGLHGMASGKFAELTDTHAFDIFIGIGNTPSENSVRLSDAVRDIASDLGLRVGINQAFIKTSANLPVLKEDGNFVKNNFKAATDNTSRSYEERVAQELSYDPALLQVELSALLRRMPEGLELDPKSRVMGAYLGYLVLLRTIEAAQTLPS